MRPIYLSPLKGLKMNVTIPLWLLDRAIQCIARAEAEGAFKDCAAPNIGNRTLAALEKYRKE